MKNCCPASLRCGTLLYCILNIGYKIENWLLSGVGISKNGNHLETSQGAQVS